MSGSFSIDGGQIVIEKDGRTVVSTQGTLVNLLPASDDFILTTNVVFPDFTKSYAYNWRFLNQYFSLASAVDQYNDYVSYQTAIPQEYDDTTDLITAPDGADIFVSRIRIKRTTAPTHTWAGTAINVIPIEDEWMPVPASLLVEAQLGMARAFSLYIEPDANPALPGVLKLHKQQSVCAAPGAVSTYGNPGFDGFVPVTGSGGSWVFGTRGMPIVTIASGSTGPVRNTNLTSPPGFGGPGPYLTDRQRGGANGGPSTMTTNFSSTYQLEILGKFGRRS